LRIQFINSRYEVVITQGKFLKLFHLQRENEANQGFDSIAQCIIALQDGGLATVATEIALLITSAQNLYMRVALLSNSFCFAPVK